MRDTKPLLLKSNFPTLHRGRIDTLQLNLGYTCNQRCLHCHVNAGPTRHEQMSRKTMQDILEYAEQNAIKQFDLTGGAPELNSEFRWLVQQAWERNIHIIDRCNLTILSEPGQHTLANFLALHQVEIVASLPCYSEDNVDKQRGKGVFNRSIEGIKALNALGYGRAGSGLVINLMYNPAGPFLPPAQQQLEADYREKLKQEYGLVFNHLYTLTNMPIMRFGSTLLSHGEFEDYIALLKQSHNPENLDTVMCRNLISIDWQGYVYDCDFNQMLDMPSQCSTSERTHISQLNPDTLTDSPVQVADHCYGCTAGCGSSCGGALS